jgi:hypothetical protein
MKLIEDFDIWWNMPKYKDTEILAKEFSDVEIVHRNGSNQGWPGPEKDVHYWVELENGYAVGIVTPKKKPATFPVYSMSYGQV